MFHAVNPTVLSTGKIRNADIKRIADDLPQWQIVAKNLDMGHQVIEDIENNHKAAPIEQRMSFLWKWIAMDGNAAIYEKLSELLMELGEQGAAERIREIARKSGTFKSNST